MHIREVAGEVKDILNPYWLRQSTYTRYYILALIPVFLLQWSIAELWDAPSVQAIMPYLFENYQLLWAVTPFIHKGIGHLIGNIITLILLLPVEYHLSKKSYGVLFVGAGLLSTYFGGWYLLEFGTKPETAYYGASGFGFGLASFALLHTIFSLDDREEVDWLTAAVGLYFLYVLGKEIFAAFANPLALNPGHLFGFASGAFLWLSLALLDNNR